jgi:RNA polymerase sigma-32 factor
MPRLSAAAERRLALRAADGDVAARNALVLANYSLINAVLPAYRWSNVNREDLEQEAALGLLRAAATFDPSRGTRFGTYAFFWIQSRVNGYVQRNRPGVGLNGKRRNPRAVVVSLEDVRHLDEDDSTLHDVIPCDGVSPEDAAVSALDGDRLACIVWQAAAESGDERVAVLVTERVLNPSPTPLRVVAKRLHISFEALRKLEKRLTDDVAERLLSLAEINPFD